MASINRDTTWGNIKAIFFELRYTMKEGIIQIKDDLMWMKKKGMGHEYKSQEELERYYRIKKDFGKLAIPMLLNFLPLGYFFVFGLIKYSPESLPTWIQVDKSEMERQLAYQHIKKRVRTEYQVETIDFNNASLEDLKILSLAVTGRIVDGTVVLNRIFDTNFQISSPPLSYLSTWLLKRHIRKHLKHNVQFHNNQLLPVEAKIQQIIRQN